MRLSSSVKKWDAPHAACYKSTEERLWWRMLRGVETVARPVREEHAASPTALSGYVALEQTASTVIASCRVRRRRSALVAALVRSTVAANAERAALEEALFGALAAGDRELVSQLRERFAGLTSSEGSAA